MLQCGHHSALLGRFPPPIFSKNLDPVPFCPPLQLWKFLLTPLQMKKKVTSILLKLSNFCC